MGLEHGGKRPQPRLQRNQPLILLAEFHSHAPRSLNKGGRADNDGSVALTDAQKVQGFFMSG